MARDWNAESFRDYIKKHHEGYDPVFWSGYSTDEFNGEFIEAREKAETFCRAHNSMLEENEPQYMTVAMVAHKAGFDIDDVENIDWDEASRIFAEESSGKAHAFIGDYCDHENNCWNTVERDAVISNDKIDNKIDFINVVTLERSELGKYELPKPQPYEKAHGIEQDQNIALKAKNPPKTEHVSSEQLADMQTIYVTQKREAQGQKFKARQMEQRLGVMQGTDEKIAELSKGREESPEVDSEIEQLKGSSAKAYEFFLRAYNVEPEKAPEAINQLRAQVEATEHELRPTEEKLRALQEEQRQQRESERAKSQIRDDMAHSYSD
ncbi:MAG: hypothetical protein FWC77_03275 [Defluviitaleaceae bacterium]|nr:hypothetical protein [Defluviitaleaceae bacterium]